MDVNTFVGNRERDICLCYILKVSNAEALERAIPYRGEIFDVFWYGAYLQRGYIDDRALEESVRASVGYLRNFLPEVLSMKPGVMPPEQTGEP